MDDDTTNTGLLVLHGNRLELLAEAVFAWLAANPLAPLEPETILVQSNGMAEWLKIELARAHGVCAATRIELPARFVWRAYRAVLGRAAVPAASPLDKLPLAWRLMRLLPRVAGEPGFEPVAGFLGDGDAARRLQLAERLADLYDQYQVHRSDWLHDWGHGADLLATAVQRGRAPAPVPDEQRWQPALWRALQSELSAAEREASRPSLHRRFVDTLRQAPPHRRHAFAGLPRRIVLFGTTHVPQQTLEAMAALAAHVQVLIAVPNPCRYHWADLIDGRELLQIARRRHALRAGRDLAAVPLHELHAHGHPLLAAWGRQSRDFVRQLDAFDEAEAARERFGVARVDLYDETHAGPATPLLQQVQAAVRDLVPIAEHPRRGARSDDRSIVFHVAHGVQREVEILHDQLLHLLAQPGDARPLNPRDIVVMVPDIDVFAPAIRSVFGQYPRSDPRYIPWGIADQSERGRQPLLVALEWLLRAPQQRFAAGELRDLLDVPAVAARLGIGPGDLPLLADWIEGAGIRWGLDLAQRRALGLEASGEQNTWAFGLGRMLLGYAAGELPAADGFAGIEPYAEVAGLGAVLAGSLAELLRMLRRWWAEASSPRPPADWALRLRGLLTELFEATDETDRTLLAALGDALASWLQACETAGFDEAVELAVVRHAWLGAFDEPGLARRFRAGGVTFCTLLPLRAIPFEVVCLLGMNEADYPRRASRSDFDLMALPDQSRPGDRSRRDDDRQLMLDALLSARRILYIGWSGRDPRDNTLQPPSVLVSQLRDYLAAGWGAEVLAQRTTEHPLQPFSRRYFESGDAGAGEALFTYAAEWRAAHLDAAKTVLVPAPAAAGAGPFTIGDLAAFLRNPVNEFFRRRLQVSFAELDAAVDDDEPFACLGLDRWALIDEVLGACRRQFESIASAPGATIDRVVAREIARLQRAGRLPIAAPGRRAAAMLHETLWPIAQAWSAALDGHRTVRGRLALRFVDPRDESLALEDWLVGLRCANGGGVPVWIELVASRVTGQGGRKAAPAPRPDKLLTAWVRSLASAACGCPAGGIVIGEGALVRVDALAPAEAAPMLASLLEACNEGLGGDAPLPTAVATGVAWLDGPEAARIAYEGRRNTPAPGERANPCLARLFPDFSSLAAQPGFDAASRRLYGPYRDWLATHVKVEAHADAPAAEAIDG